MKKFFRFAFKLTFVIGLSIFVLSAAAQVRREVGNLVLEDVPEVPQEIIDRLQQYQNTRSAIFADWLPGDGGMLISTRFGNTMQLHTVALPGGARSQVTFYNEPVTSASFSPSADYNGFLFSRDVGGNEFAQFFWYDMDQRTARMISDGSSMNILPNWSNKGDRFTFTSTRRNGRDFDIYLSGMAEPDNATLLVDRGRGGWGASDWSPDDTKLLVIQRLSANISNSFILDLSTRQLTPINDPGQQSVFEAIAWNHDASKIYVVTNLAGEFTTLALYDIKTGSLSHITGNIPWDLLEFTMNRDRSKAAFTVNENGFSRLYLLNTSNNAFELVTSLPMGQVRGLSFHPQRNELAMVINTTQTPGDVYSLDLEKNELKRWTYSEVGGLETTMFPDPELIFYETFDSIDGQPRMIPAFVYKPKKGQGPFPVLINIHGGPEAQHVPVFSAFNAFLANELGVAVIGPNVRGSTGYGKTYLDLDNGYLREDAVKDIGTLIDWIGKQPGFDASRIAVYGGSYGGYMVLASMVHFGDRIRCGIDVVGISNFVTFLENTEEYRRDLRRVEYGDERDPAMREFLLNISPANHAHKINKPLFVIQGANDPRVPASESEQMVRAIRQNKGTVWYMLALDEGHGFRKKENSDRMSEAIAYFLKLNLLGN
jgi:dipeptidyl aminopeptidase/acylaminoacyl peptidase